MSNKLETIEIYRKLAEDALSKTRSFINGEIGPSEEEHIINVAKSIMLTRDNILQGGSFAQSVVNNDLAEAINRADNTSIKAIKFFVYCNRNIHPNQF